MFIFVLCLLSLRPIAYVRQSFLITPTKHYWNIRDKRPLCKTTVITLFNLSRPNGMLILTTLYLCIFNISN